MAPAPMDNRREGTQDEQVKLDGAEREDEAGRKVVPAAGEHNRNSAEQKQGRDVLTMCEMRGMDLAA